MRYIINKLGDGLERKTDMGPVLLKQVIVPLDDEGYELCKTVLDEVALGESGEVSGGGHGT